MKFHTTPAQRKILQTYWADHKPFTLETLLEEKIVRFPRLARFCLFRMEGKGQILPCGVEQYQVRYIGTTESKKEWKSLRAEKNPFQLKISEDFGMKGMNAFECEQQYDWMMEVIEEAKEKLRARQNKQ